MADLLCVKQTSYGGRGYFATSAIRRDTIVLLDLPIVASVFDDFKKEVCLWCFAYNNGKTHPIMVGTSSRACSEACRDTFLHKAYYGHVQQNWDTIQRQKKKLGNDVDYDLLRFCIAAIPLTKSGYEEQMNRLTDLQGPDVDPSCVEHLTSADESLEHNSDQSLTKTELQSAFDVLAAVQKVDSFPAAVLQRIIFRVIGKSRSNCFGIWQQLNGSSFPESEMFGYGLYAKSSYFNHSCLPNVGKLRRGRTLQFTTIVDIAEGEELTISYLGDREYANTAERQKALKGWGFDCICVQCRGESEKVT